MNPITVLICDDSALIRNMLSEMLNAEADIQVVGTAVDPFDAREKIKKLNPQVLTLDIEMPNMDGLSFLEKIMTLRPMPVIMISTHTQKGASATIKALELGAVDCLGKSGQMGSDLQTLREELVAKVRTAAQANVTRRTHAVKTKSEEVIPFDALRGASPSHLIAIGSSTGGVEALRDIFVRLPSNTPPIVIAQHMPAQFTPSFAARLDSISQVNVSEAQHEISLKNGCAYLAPGGRQLSIKKIGHEWKCFVEEGTSLLGHRPSVDVLFNSVADAAGSNAVGVILTGMGSDGAQGMLRMRESGAYNIGQNQSSCVV